MTDDAKKFTILMADDDPEDCQMVKDALAEAGLDHDLRVVGDGEELFDYLNRRDRFSDAEKFPRPDLLLLDLNMPRKDGREALRELKADPDFQRIPVVVLTTSVEDDDVGFCYNAGASSYCAKPSSYSALCELMQVVSKYWFEHVRLPE
jgi:CheY-like chemotaxis protein